LKRNTGKTSLNQVPAGMKKVEHWPGPANLDYGGGKYLKATKWLAENRGVMNFVYDKYNKTWAENTRALVASDMCQSLTCFNTLNVMETLEERYEVYSMIKRMPKLEYAFISVYVGDRSGKGKETSRGWQNNE
jgi:hypothetical protein